MQPTRLAATLVAPVLILALFGPADARPLAKAEARALDAALTAYLGAIATGDAEKIVAAMPPRVLTIFAGATGTEEAALTATLVAQTDALMQGAAVRDLAADQSALDAADAALADGTGVVWVVVPTAFVSEAAGKTSRNEQPLLALSEGRGWYFLRIDGPERRQVAALAYPFLATAELPEARIVPVE